MEKKNKISNEQKWFVGLLEAEGRVEFNENGVSKDGNKKWAFMIKVSLKNTNRRSIHRIKKIWGAGKVLEDKAGMVTIKLTDKAAIREKIIPILDGFPLRGEKNIEYQVFKQAMDIEESKLDRRVIDSKLEELKTREKKPQNQVTPEISKDRGVSAKTEIDKMSEAKLQEVFDPWWLAGYIEGAGMFQINTQLEPEFEIGQKSENQLVYGIKRLLSTSEERERDMNRGLLVKSQEGLERLTEYLKGKMLGMKSFEYRVFTYAIKTKEAKKKQRARDVLASLREGVVVHEGDTREILEENQVQPRSR